jgi:hypothetical protein
VHYIYVHILSLVLCSHVVCLMLLDDDTLVSFLPAGFFLTATVGLIAVCSVGLLVKKIPSYLKVIWLFTLPVLVISVLYIGCKVY